MWRESSGLLYKKCVDNKIYIKQVDKLFRVMLKDGRLTKEELRKYFKKRRKKNK